MPAQQDDQEVNWLSVEQAEKLASENPRPLFIDIYTDWCGWCRRMDSETLSHPAIAKILNEEFYPVKLNAETNDEIKFQGQTFINDGNNGRTHQLAIAIGTVEGRIGYPTVAFFNEELQLLTAIPGFRTARDMEPLLMFFASESYKNISYEEFLETFEGTITTEGQPVR